MAGAGTVPVMVTRRLPQRPWRSSQDRYPDAIRGGPSAVVTWVEQTCPQLVLMSVIRVSQNVQAGAAHKRAEATFRDASATLHEVAYI
jgi:hypothetical protein